MSPGARSRAGLFRVLVRLVSGFHPAGRSSLTASAAVSSTVLPSLMASRISRQCWGFVSCQRSMRVLAAATPGRQSACGVCSRPGTPSRSWMKIPCSPGPSALVSRSFVSGRSMRRATAQFSAAACLRAASQISRLLAGSWTQCVLTVRKRCVCERLSRGGFFTGFRPFSGFSSTVFGRGLASVVPRFRPRSPVSPCGSPCRPRRTPGSRFADFPPVGGFFVRFSGAFGRVSAGGFPGAFSGPPLHVRIPSRAAPRNGVKLSSAPDGRVPIREFPARGRVFRRPPGGL